MDPILIALTVTGFGYMWWRQKRRTRQRILQLSTRIDESAEIALHVARHEAQQRGLGIVTTTCLLYGLLQEETIIEAITATGGDPDAIEDHVLAALDQGAGDFDASPVVAWQFQMASSHSRRLRAADLWTGLVTLRPDPSSTVPPSVLPSALMDAGGVKAADVSFTLTHGRAEKDIPWPEHRSVCLVLINDDITTQEFVVELLRDVFGKGDAAQRLMMQVHQHGRGVIGAFDPEEARSKFAAARERARSAGFPLWIKAE